jgi:hypothetical protein
MRDINETVSLLARISRFIIADLTDPSSIPRSWKPSSLEPLLATLAERVIAPAEGKVKALAERRCLIEAELTKLQ